MNSDNAAVAADIESLVSRLIPAVEASVPEEGDFTLVYTEYKNRDPHLCLTDVLLKVEPVPQHIAGAENQRYLTCVGYKLPAPIKSSCVIVKGTKAEILHALHDSSTVGRLKILIPRLSDNLDDC